MQIDKEIDTSGLNCPLPILKAKKALNDMSSGQVLKIIATDPGAWRDFEAFLADMGERRVMVQWIFPGREMLGPNEKILKPQQRANTLR